MIDDPVYRLMRDGSDDELLLELERQIIDSPLNEPDNIPWWGNHLTWAVQCNKTWVIIWLVKHGLDVKSCNIHSQTAMHTAAFCGNAPMIELLLQLGADVADEDLWYAARADKRCIQLILPHVKNVNVRGHKGRTPLMEAAIAGSEENVQLLLASGADPHLRTTYGMSALDFARKRQRDAIVLILESPIAGRPA